MEITKDLETGQCMLLEKRPSIYQPLHGCCTGQGCPLSVWKAKASVEVGPFSLVACHSSKPGHGVKIRLTLPSGWSVTE